MCAQTLATFGMGAHFCLGYPLYMQVMHAQAPLALLCLHGCMSCSGRCSLTRATLICCVSAYVFVFPSLLSAMCGRVVACIFIMLLVLLLGMLEAGMQMCYCVPTF